MCYNLFLRISQSNNYQNIAKDFIYNYCTTAGLNIFFTSIFYTKDTLCSIHIIGSTNQLYEVIGTDDILKKLNELGITTMKFITQNYTVQPINQNIILITFHGNVEINGRNYTIISTVLIHIESIPKIHNHIIDIIM